MLRTSLILLAAACCGSLRAHTVPVIVIEAEFSSARDAVIKVNLDPRLFLSPQPTSLPPVPASWWFDQDDASKAQSKRAAADYVSRTFTFTVGTTALKADWKVEPIDSASAFPLGQASTEAHLLLEHRGTLPTTAGDFKLAVGKECAVAVILLTSKAGDAERRPQSLFPGETSRAFPLPEPVQPAPKASETSKKDPGIPTARLAWITRSAHFIGDHLALAALLGLALPRRCWRAIGLLATFHVADAIATSLVLAGWLPSAPIWMTIAFWIALALTAIQLLVLKSKDASAFITLAVAGLCHGLNVPHLHLEAANAAAATLVFTQTGALVLLELAVLLSCATLLHLAHRRKGRTSCTSAT